MRILFSFSFIAIFQLFVAQPANDNCEDAIAISDGIAQTFNSVQATTDGPEHPNAACFSFGGDNVHNDIWFAYTSSTTGFVQWSTCNTVNFDTRLAVYNSGILCPVIDEDLLACNDDGIACDNFTSDLLFEVEAGQTYILRLGGYVEGDFGEGTFDLMPVADPVVSAHSNCADADFVGVVTEEQAEQNEGWVYGNNFYAPAQDGVEPPSCVPMGEFYDVWYSFNNGLNDTIIVNFEALTDSATFEIEIYAECDSVAPTQIDGGEILIGCFVLANGFVDSLEIVGFENPNDYIMRISSQITNFFPGEFKFQLIGYDEAVSTQDIVNNEFNIWPNPSSSEISILSPFQKSQLTLFNMNGQVILSQDINKQARISLHDTPTGIYLIELKNENQVLRKKLIVR